MSRQPISETWRRWRSARSNRLQTLPIAILMPHSGCNCRCVMCDIWKGNGNRRLLERKDIEPLLASFRRLHTQVVLLTGGEALLHPNFFELCALMKAEGLYITLLSTGLTLARHATRLVEAVDEVIVSLDGDPETHDRIRNVPGAFARMAEGLRALKALRPGFRISGRSVIQSANFRRWSAIVQTAKDIGLDSISFLPADTGSSAFNRAEPWSPQRAGDVSVAEADWPLLEAALDELLQQHPDALARHYILEPEAKLRAIVTYYKAIGGKAPFPGKQCNAPWVSAVVEADGTVRPCFFLKGYGNLREQPFEELLNSAEARSLRRSWKRCPPDACSHCVCSLHLPLHQSPLPA